MFVFNVAAPLGTIIQTFYDSDVKVYPKIDTVSMQGRATIGSPAKCHLNGVSLAGGCRPALRCLLGFSIILRSTDNLFYLMSQSESPCLIVVFLHNVVHVSQGKLTVSDL